MTKIVTLLLKDKGKTVFTCLCVNLEVAIESGELWNNSSLSHSYTLNFESEVSDDQNCQIVKQIESRLCNVSYHP